MPAPHPKDAANLGGAGPIAAYLAVCVIWGSTFLAIRIAVETLPPWTMVGARSVTAGLILGLFALSRGARWPDARGAWSGIVTGLLLFAGCQSMLAWGEIRLPSGQAAMLACTVSLMTPLLSWLIGASRRPGPTAIAGLLLGFVGTAMLTGTGGSITDRAAYGAVLLSSVLWALGAAVARRFPPAKSAMLGSALQMFSGGIGALLIGMLRGEWDGLASVHVSGRSWLALAYLVVMGSLVGFACFGWLVQIWQPERVSTYAFVNPLVALFLGTTLAGETVGWHQLQAGALILAAVGLVVFGNRQRRPIVVVPETA